MGKGLKDIISGFTPSKIIGDSAGAVVSNIMDGLDGLITSKEERMEMEAKITAEVNRHTEAVRNADLEETKAYLSDTANARDNNAKIQESEHASWLAKNVGYCLDITFTLAFLIMLGVIVYKVVPEQNKELFYTGFGALGTYVATILSFHRGSSKGSEDKQKHLMEAYRK